MRAATTLLRRWRHWARIRNIQIVGLSATLLSSLTLARQVIVIGEVNGRVGRLADAFAEKRHRRARRGDGNREGERATIFEREMRGEAFSYGKFGSLTIGRKGEAEGGVGVGGSGIQQNDFCVLDNRLQRDRRGKCAPRSTAT